MTRGTCPHCGRQIALRQDGTLRHHLAGHDGPWQVVCPGKGRPPQKAHTATQQPRTTGTTPRAAPAVYGQTSTPQPPSQED